MKNKVVIDRDLIAYKIIEGIGIPVSTLMNNQEGYESIAGQICNKIPKPIEK